MLICVGIVILVGCTLALPPWGREIDLDLILPRPPEIWAALGPVEHLVLVGPPVRDAEPAAIRVGADSGSVRIRVEKRTNLPFLDFPLLRGRSDLLKPAGGIFPLDLDARGRLCLSYRRGFLADLLFPVCRERDLIEAINAARLGREIWERSEGDPWVLDRDAILNTLLYGTMRSDKIRKRESFDLSLELPTGTWIPGDPFCSALSASAEAPTTRLIALPTGLHHFFRSDESGQPLERIDLMLDEDGWLWTDSTTGAGGSGRW